ncbi:hypothetical protein AGR1C_pAt40095 [Agrobacterium fabacearum TT111]|nr:hypothetical protein AGR1C_pAt40095 [Agrobacterium fabacearum TT111]
MTEASFPTVEIRYDADDGTQPICGIMRLTGSGSMNKQCLASRHFLIHLAARGAHYL